jgi:hypothetical protein
VSPVSLGSRNAQATPRTTAPHRRRGLQLLMVTIEDGSVLGMLNNLVISGGNLFETRLSRTRPTGAASMALSVRARHRCAVPTLSVRLARSTQTFCGDLLMAMAPMSLLSMSRTSVVAASRQGYVRSTRAHRGCSIWLRCGPSSPRHWCSFRVHTNRTPVDLIINRPRQGLHLSGARGFQRRS